MTVVQRAPLKRLLAPVAALRRFGASLLTYPRRLPRWVRLAVTWGSLFVLMVLVFGGSAYLTLWLGVRAEVVTVPDLIGITLEEAERIASNTGLRLERIDGRHDERVGQGRVMNQEPPSKSSTKVGRTIRVTESLGPATAQVPDLRGGSLRRAQIALTARGLRVSTHARVLAGEVPHGQVIHQDPPAGTVEWPGAGVSLLLSAGPRMRTYIMPDLRRRSRETVERWIARQGLRLGRVANTPAPGMPAGAVVDQRPLPGHPLDPRLPVALTVTEP